MANIIKQDIGGTGRRAFTARKVFLLVILAGIISLGGFAAYTYLNNKGVSKNEPSAVSDKLGQASDLAARGNKQEALKVVQQFIDSPTATNDEKAAAYATKGSILEGRDKLDALIKAYALSPTSSAAGNVAEWAEQYGDKQLALEYYQRAIDTKDENAYQATLDAYKARIGELSNAKS